MLGGPAVNPRGGMNTVLMAGVVSRQLSTASERIRCSLATGTQPANWLRPGALGILPNIFLFEQGH